jgi:hypothetical protein
LNLKSEKTGFKHLLAFKFNLYRYTEAPPALSSLSPVNPLAAASSLASAASLKRLGSVKRLEGIMDAGRSGHMLVVPCRRLSPLLPTQGPPSPSLTTQQQQKTSPLKRRKASVHGVMSHRKLLKIAAADWGGAASSPTSSPPSAAGNAGGAAPATDALAAAADSTTTLGGLPALAADSRFAYVNNNNDENSNNDSIDDKTNVVTDVNITADRLADVLDSMYQAAGPAGVLLLAGVTRRRTPCGRYDVNTVALQHDNASDSDSANAPTPLVSHVPVHQVLWQAAEVGLLLDPSGCFVAGLYKLNAVDP